MSESGALTFPPMRAAWLTASEDYLPSGLRWRDARDEDLPFLRVLYGETRAAELAAVPWPDAARQAFLDSQFALQHQSYTSHYQPADFLLIEYEGRPAGRLYLHRGEREALIIDIALLDAMRGRGLGTALLQRVQRRAHEDRLDAVTLHVEQRNHAARRLYERLGFVVEGETGHHLRMRWRTAASLS